MIQLAAPPPPSRTQLAIQRPPSVLDSSDEARTDTSTSPAMNPARTPGSDTKSSSGVAAAKTPAATPSSSSNSRRRKADAATEDKPAAKQRKYERKTKRFIWPDDLHRLFVAAIFDVGLKNASPKALLALMEAAGPNAGLTTEHLKSHLQKYRLNYERSRMEFLEYYDRSAKRNSKRRRRQAQHRASGAGSEANTMFVFPISNSKRRKGLASDSDSDDSDSDAGDSHSNDTRMEVDAQYQATPNGRRGSPVAAAEAHARSVSYSQLMQSGQHQPGLDGNSHLRQPATIPNDRMVNVAPSPVSSGLIAIAPQHLPPAYAAHVQRKQSPPHDRDLAAAAAAMAAYRYPLAQPGGGVPGMPELMDPQWSILNSLMSPQLAGMTGPVGDGGVFPQAPQVPTSEAMARGSADGFMLQEEPTDLQMQMHLAMQAQMNIHRQMLTRKVEVAQHLARHSSMGSIDTGAVSNSRGFTESWGSAQQLQQQQYLQQQRQQQQRQQQERQQKQQQEQEHYQQQMDLLARPSLSAPPVTATPSAPTTAPLAPPGAAPPASAAMIVSTSAADSPPSAVAVTDSSAIASLATEVKGDEDAMDLSRWDSLDQIVGVDDDDDLFSFLKS